MSTDYPQPIVHSEKGFDQTDVPSEKANQAPDEEPTISECDPTRDLHSTPHRRCILR